MRNGGDVIIIVARNHQLGSRGIVARLLWYVTDGCHEDALYGCKPSFERWRRSKDKEGRLLTRCKPSQLIRTCQGEAVSCLLVPNAENTAV